MRRNTTLLALGASAALVAAAFAGSLPASANEPDPKTRQGQYASAAARYQLPESVLLAVSYLESRWDTNGGNPSTSAGFGPMHLTDFAAAGAAGAAVDHHHDGSEDARGDTRRPLVAKASRPAAKPAAGIVVETLDQAAKLTGSTEAELRTKPAANIAGGAALLATYQKQLGLPLSADPAAWYGAVAKYSGAKERGTAKAFADEVYKVLAEGATRVTDDGHRVTLKPTAATPDRSVLDKLGLKAPLAKNDPETECPAGLGCEWIPAPFGQFGDPVDYGNHDKSDRPKTTKINYIVVHDTEVDYDTTIALNLDITRFGWHYTMRASDGHIAQSIKTKDVGWHAGNWFINGQSIGIEHEGYAARGTWYTEIMYRNSARLVRYLAKKYDIPLDRHHIIGHDTLIGPLNANLTTTHWDPGPYWDWAHYFALMGAPIKPSALSSRGGMVTIKPDFETNKPAYTNCEDNPGPPSEGGVNIPCGDWGSSAFHLRTEPRDDAPLVKDIGRNPPDGTSTMKVSDQGARVSAGVKYAIADVQGDWVAIWYLGQKGWFKNPASKRNAVWSSGWVVTPKEGRESIPIYGRPYPEAAAYPPDIPVQAVIPLKYNMPAGQRYAYGFTITSEYFWSMFDTTKNVFVRGKDKYHQIQWGHRIGYVKASDVDVKPSGLPW
jgi:hypothetical protein